MPGSRLAAAAAALALLAACTDGGPATTTSPTPTGSPTGSPTSTSSPSTSPTTSPTDSTPPDQADGPSLTRLLDGPVVDAAAGETFVNAGWTVQVDETLWMFRNSFSSFPGPSRTDLLRSDDGGRTWFDQGPVLTSDDVALTDGSAFVMAGWIDDAGWHALISTHEGNLNRSVIARADAPGPAGPWTVSDTPALEPGPADAFDGRRLREPSAIVDDDGTVRLYYTGYPGSRDGQVGLATSTDGGATFTRRDQPVLPATEDWVQGGTGGAQVIRNGDGWVMVYDSSQRGAPGIGVAFSDDGIAWTPHDGNPILTPDDTPGGLTPFQMELVDAADGRRLLLLELGGGSTSTAVYLYELVLPAG